MLAEELGRRACPAPSVDRSASRSPPPRCRRCTARRLRDGREVVLKVQRPGTARAGAQRPRGAGRFAALPARAHRVRQPLRRRRSCSRSSASRCCASSTSARRRCTSSRIAANLREIPEIIVPQPVIGYTTARVLAMEFICGHQGHRAHALERRELDGERLADALFRAYLKQILRDGLFHADPHPGNVFLVDGKARADRPRHGGARAAGTAGTAAAAPARGQRQPARRRRARCCSMRRVPRGRRPEGVRARRHRPHGAAPRDVVPAAAGRARGADAAQGGGRARHPPAGRARDDRQDAAQPRRDRPHARAAFRPERRDPPPRRRHHAGADVARPLARLAVQRGGRARRTSSSTCRRASTASSTGWPTTSSRSTSTRSTRRA